MSHPYKDDRKALDRGMQQAHKYIRVFRGSKINACYELLKLHPTPEREAAIAAIVALQILHRIKRISKDFKS